MRAGTTPKARAGCTTGEAGVKIKQLVYPAKQLVYPAISRIFSAAFLIISWESSFGLNHRSTRRRFRFSHAEPRRRICFIAEVFGV